LRISVLSCLPAVILNPIEQGLKHQSLEEIFFSRC
jgi:hypothetical protein